MILLSANRSAPDDGQLLVVWTSPDDTSMAASKFQLNPTQLITSLRRQTTNKAARRQAYLLWKVAAVLLHPTGNGKQQHLNLIDQTEPYTRDGVTGYKATCRRR